MENFNEKLFLLKYSIGLEKKYQNRAKILIKKRFLQKFIFHRNFLFEKSGKSLLEHFFSTFIYKLGKI